jgi:eukaryotic-like serine/threonine-protein kinase
VNAATEIYSLGVTLYELLTLRPAFDAGDRQELVKRILDDEPVPPRHINPSIPRDLETIVLKAMEKEPSARYVSAGELADDLRRFLGDQPIRARRPGLVDRAVKWSRRHRPAVLAGLAALILTLAASTAVLWEAKRRTDATLASYRKALVEERQAIEYSLGSLDQITRPLAAASGPELNRDEEARRVLPWAISFYDRLPTLVANLEMLKELFPKAYRQAGFCRMALNRPRGRDDYRRAIRLYEELAAERPEQIWLRTGLIETLYEYSRLLTAPADKPEAESSFRRALAVAESLIGDREAAKHCYTMGLVGPFNDLAWALVRRPDVTPSDADLALRLARQATDWEPKQAGLWNTLGMARYRLGDRSSAAAAFQKSMDLNDGGDPADWFFLAALDHHAGRKQEARRWFDRSVAWMEQNQGRDKERDAELAQFRQEVAAILSK